MKVITVIAQLLVITSGVDAILKQRTYRDLGTSSRVNYFHSRIPIHEANALLDPEVKGNLNGSYEVLKIGKYDHESAYLCYVPSDNTTNSSEPETDIHDSYLYVEKEKELIEKGVKELPKSFSNKFCLFSNGLNGGYWTFAYCYGNKVVQFHDDTMRFMKTGKHYAENPDFVFTLGHFRKSKKKNKSKLEEDGIYLSDFTLHDEFSEPLSTNLGFANRQRYLKHTLNDGSICDITGKPRSIDVVYKCIPSSQGEAQIIDVQELKSCKYHMVVGVPSLCNIEEFSPDTFEDMSIDIDCKLIDQETNGESNTKQSDSLTTSHDDFLAYAYDKSLFLSTRNLTNDFKLNLFDFDLTYCGLGFYLGHHKTDAPYLSDYFGNRSILIFNGLYYSTEELIGKMANMLLVTIGSKISSPVTIDGKPIPLSWNDSFILWYELYDFVGYLHKLVRIQKVAATDSRIISIQIIDPATMTDQDGDFVLLQNDISALKDSNFEAFTQASTGVLSDLDDSAEHIDDEIVLPETTVITITEKTYITDTSAKDTKAPDHISLQHDEL